ncbi:MAG TPA: D-alanyl-D-alanine carboxypeptidase family protein [Gammaproteobacteria bacterium]|nr:D-alanyl-D-alanine carboxypeptidase family protein [Gammaproteobacteria bacterium]HRA43105.1 D-alanyl-D-alanine carboxypeptidase family protein [Gammaproteobacteria bacterium]
MQLKFKSRVIALFASLFCPFALFAELAALPQPTLVIPAPPTLQAKSFILIDPLSNYVIAEQNVEQRVEPASLTKMMTVYVVDHVLKSGKLKLTDTVKISEKAWKSPGSRMFVEVNTDVSVDDLLRGIIIASGNDASVAIAEHIAGSESAFAELMNFYAKQLGLANTHFVNSTGLPDPNHYTSARDMAILSKALMRDFPESYTLYSEKTFLYQNIKQENRNRLLWTNNLVDGIKTGHTDSAGYCLVASGKKDNMRLIAVVMGTKNNSARIDETNKLLTYGFRFYESRKLYPALTALKKGRVWHGREKEVDLGLAEDLYVTIGQGQYDNLKTTITVENLIKAPTNKGAALGTLTVQLDNKTISECPVVALTDVEAGGFINRLYDNVTLSVLSLVEKVKPK